MARRLWLVFGFAALTPVIGMAASIPASENRGGAPGGYYDPVFSTIPFEQWMAQGQSHIHWTARITDPVLSNHQRLTARSEMEIDGKELARRRGKGVFRMFVQLTDEQGRNWQSHDEIDLEKVEKGFHSSDAVYIQSFFVLPGDYKVSLLIEDTETGEHSAMRKKLHAVPLKNDPLPEAWRNLPSVEFIHPEKPPDNWYQPGVEGRLNLSVEPRHSVDIRLILNLTPSERFSGSTRVQSRNMGALIPSLKVLSQVAWRNATLSVEFLDLVRRQVVWRQNKVEELEWARASDSLAVANPGIIDVQSLLNRRYEAAFFLRDIFRAIGRPATIPRVLIILSAPVAFEAGEEIGSIKLTPRPDFSVYYIRYQPLPPLAFASPRRRDGDMAEPLTKGMAAVHNLYGPQIDQLEPMLKPIDPRLFDVSTPEQFRRAVSVILSEVARM